MILRIRTPDGGNYDVPLGPAPARMKANTYHVSVATVPNMIPVMPHGAYLENRYRRRPQVPPTVRGSRR